MKSDIKFVNGFNARVNGLNKAPDGSYATRDGYNTANILFNKQTTLSIRERKVPVYPTIINNDVLLRHLEAESWTQQILDSIN